jgi:hypothetical protein
VPAGGGGERARNNSECSLEMKPGSIGVPPTTRIEDASVLRKSTGT